MINRSAGTHSERIGMKKAMRVISACCIVAASFLLVTSLLVMGFTNKSACEKDFIEYWAAGQQLFHGDSPYDPGAVFRLEHAAGQEGNQPKITFSPPVAFFFLVPLAFVGPKTGLILWTLALIACLLISVWMVWIVQGGPDDGLHWCGYMFPPAIACIMAGQISIFLLLGIMIFLSCYEHRPYVAGAALLPCAWKPHLFLPLFLVLILSSIIRKEWRVLAGFGAALIFSCALTLYFDRHIWSQYFQMMRETGVLHAYVPTLSVSLRFLINRKAVWVQLIPEVAACGWAVWYYWTRRDQWTWMDQGMLVLLISALVTPYAWFSDEAVLMPAVLFGIYSATSARRSLLPIVIIGTVALIEISTIGKMASPYYLWTTPAWLGWYLYATSTGPARVHHAAVVASN